MMAQRSIRRAQLTLQFAVSQTRLGLQYLQNALSKGMFPRIRALGRNRSSRTPIPWHDAADAGADRRHSSGNPWPLTVPLLKQCHRISSVFSAY
jgi:hypothetical protein